MIVGYVEGVGISRGYVCAIHFILYLYVVFSSFLWVFFRAMG